MRAFLSQFKFLGLVLLGISAVIIYLFYNALQPQKTLKVYSPSMVNEELVAQEIQHIRKYHTIADFSLTNQIVILVIFINNETSRRRPP